MNNKRLRHYNSLWDLFKGIRDLIRGILAWRKAGDAARIPSSLAEKVMLAVTGVNECAYCSFLHAQTALVAGVGKEEIDRILAGMLKPVNEYELPALLYAQHWAESMGNVSPDAKRKLLDFYGGEKAKGIEASIRAVYMGNMCSNTVVFFEDKNIPKSGKKGLLPVYLFCKPIAMAILGRASTLTEKTKG